MAKPFKTLSGKGRIAAAAHKEPVVAKGPEPEAPPPASGYPMKTAVVFGVVHVVFVLIITIWGLSLSILQPHNVQWIIRMLEIPGALFVSLIGQAENIDSFLPYLIAYLINTLIYAGIGYGVGIIIIKYRIDVQLKTILHLEEEAYQ
ncbi:MAG: hypothetical protein V1701_07470 [Planctomycetota bacterium]